MADKTDISWADSTFNPWIGCTKVGPGCDHCYAEADFDHRKHRVVWGQGNPRSRTSADNWRKPLQWERQHTEFFAQHGRRRRVFCSSLADVFDNEVPPEWRADLFDLIANTPHLDWMLLTKRIGNAAEMMDAALMDDGPTWPWSNLWLGATICNQTEADRDIPKLLRVPAAVRFLSMEPLLGPVKLTWNDLSDGMVVEKSPAVDWVIVGGESGPKARPMHPEWAVSLRNQCKAAGVAFHFKQWGQWAPECSRTHQQRPIDAGQIEECYVRLDGSTHWIDPDDQTPYSASDALMLKVGKKHAGRLLDGRIHAEFPEPAHG